MRGVQLFKDKVTNKKKGKDNFISKMKLYMVEYVGKDSCEEKDECNVPYRCKRLGLRDVQIFINLTQQSNYRL